MRTGVTSCSFNQSCSSSPMNSGRCPPGCTSVCRRWHAAVRGMAGSTHAGSARMSVLASGGWRPQSRPSCARNEPVSQRARLAGVERLEVLLNGGLCRHSLSLYPVLPGYSWWRRPVDHHVRDALGAAHCCCVMPHSGPAGVDQPERVQASARGRVSRPHIQSQSRRVGALHRGPYSGGNALRR